MTPELAAERAADILAIAEHADNDRAIALVQVADAWTRLHDALTNTPKISEPITVNIDSAVIKDVDPEQIAADIRRAMGIPEPGQVEPEPELWNPYRERAALVAHLAALFPSMIVPDADPEAPGWPVIYVNTPRGQLSWHLSRDDLDLFGHVPVFEDGQAPTWDGHTTAEKYERLAALVRDMMTP